MESESKIDLQGYKIIDTIGIGPFGQVFLVENNDTQKQYAAKVSYKEFTNEVDQVYFASLMNSFSRLQNPAIQKIEGFNLVNFFGEKRFTILNDYMPKGSLNQVFKTERNLFTITKRYLNLLGIAFGMQYLHSKDIIHGNLNPNNILLDDQNYPHIADFGLSKFITKHFIDLKSPIYTAPEILEEKEFDAKADVYSYSLIAYKIITGLDPFVEGPNYLQIQNILKGKRPDLSSIKDKNWNKFLQKCWSKNPKDRPSFDQIIQTLTDPTFYSLIKINFTIVSRYLKHYYPNSNMFQGNDADDKPQSTFNIFLLGNAASGKSAMLEVFKNVTANHPQPQTTLAPSNTQITVKTEIGSTVLSIYDTPGHEKYNRMISQYLNVAHAAVYVTDISVKDEYKLLSNWMNLVKENSQDSMLYLVAAKSDLQWANTKEELTAFAEAHHLQLFITSWDDRESVESVFNKVALDLIEKYPDGNEKNFEI